MCEVVINVRANVSSVCVRVWVFVCVLGKEGSYLADLQQDIVCVCIYIYVCNYVSAHTDNHDSYTL